MLSQHSLRRARKSSFQLAQVHRSTLQSIEERRLPFFLNVIYRELNGTVLQRSVTRVCRVTLLASPIPGPVALAIRSVESLRF